MISQRMLTATVRNLERDGMLTRHVYERYRPAWNMPLPRLAQG